MALSCRFFQIPFALGLISMLAGVAAFAAAPAASPAVAAQPRVKITCDGHKTPDGHPFEAIHQVQPSCQVEVEKEFELSDTLAKVRAAITEKSKALASAAANAGGSSEKGALDAIKNTISTSVADLAPSLKDIAQAQKDVGITHDLANTSAEKITSARVAVNTERLKLLSERLTLTNDYNLMVQKQLPERQQLLARQKSQGINDGPGLENSIQIVQSRITSDKARLEVLAVEIPKFEQAEKSFVAAYADHQNVARSLAKTRADLSAQNTALNELVEKSKQVVASLDGASKGLGQIPSPDSTSTNANISTAPGPAPLNDEQKKLLKEYSHGAALEAGIADGTANPGSTTVNGADTSAMSHEDRLKFVAQEATLNRQQKLDADLAATGGYDGLSSRTRSGVATLASYQAAIINTENDPARDAAVKKYNSFMASECQNTAVCEEYTRLGVMREIASKNFTEIVIPQMDPASGFYNGVSDDTGKSAFNGNLGLKSALKETTSASYRSDVEEGVLKEQETLNSGFKKVADAAASATKEREWAQSKSAQDLYDYSQKHAYDYSDGGMPLMMEDPKKLAADASHKLVDANAYAAGLMATTDATSHNFVMDGVAGAVKDQKGKETVANIVGVVPILGTGLNLYNASSAATEARFDTAQSGSAVNVVAAEDTAKANLSSAKVALAVDVASTVLPLDKLVIHPAKATFDWISGGTRAAESVAGDSVRVGSEVSRVAESAPTRDFLPMSGSTGGSFPNEMHASLPPVAPLIEDTAARAIADQEGIAAKKIAAASRGDLTVARSTEEAVAQQTPSRAPASLAKSAEAYEPPSYFASNEAPYQISNDARAATFNVAADELPRTRSAYRPPSNEPGSVTLLSARHETTATSEAAPLTFFPQESFSQLTSHYSPPAAQNFAAHKFESGPLKASMNLDRGPGPLVNTKISINGGVAAPIVERRQATTGLTTASMASPYTSASLGPKFAISRDFDRGFGTGYGSLAPPTPPVQKTLTGWDRIAGSMSDAGQVQAHPFKSLSTGFQELSTSRELNAAVREVTPLPGGKKLADEAVSLAGGMRQDFTRQRDALRSASVEMRGEARASAEYSIRQRVASFEKAQNDFKAVNAANPDAIASANRIKAATNAKLAAIENSNDLLSGKKLATTTSKLEGTTVTSRFSAEVTEVNGRKFSAQALDIEKTMGTEASELRRQSEELLRLRASLEMRGGRLTDDMQLRYEALEYRNSVREVPLVANDIDGPKFWNGVQNYDKMSLDERRAWLKEAGDSRHPEADKEFTRILAGEKDDSARQILRDIANHRGLRVDYQSVMGTLAGELVDKSISGQTLTGYAKRELREMPGGILDTFLSSPVAGVRANAAEGLLGRDPTYLAKYAAGDDLPVARAAAMGLKGNSSEEAKAVLIHGTTSADRDVRRESLLLLSNFRDYDAQLAFHRAEKGDLPELTHFQSRIFTIKQRAGGQVEFIPKLPQQYSHLGDNAFVSKMLSAKRETVLASIGEVSQRPAAVSYQLLRHDSPEVRISVAKDLFNRSVSDKQAIRDLLRDPVAEVRVEAISAIAHPEFGTSDRTWLLRDAVQHDPDPIVRERAFIALNLNSETGGEKFFEPRSIAAKNYITGIRDELGNVSVNEDHLLPMAVARHIYSYPEMRDGVTAEQLYAEARNFELSAPAGTRPAYVITDFASGTKGGVYRPETFFQRSSEPVIVAWGGTEGTTDVLADMSYGISQAKSAAANHVNEFALKEVIENKSRLIAVGHSLGGALAEGTGARVEHGLTEARAKFASDMIKRENRSTSDLVRAQNHSAVSLAMDRTEVITFNGLGGMESIKAAGFYHAEEAALLKTTNYRLSSDVISRLGTHVGSSDPIDLGSKFGYFAAAKDHMLDSLHERFLKSTAAETGATKAVSQISMDSLQKPAGAAASALMKMRATLNREKWVNTLMDARRLQVKNLEFGRLKPEFSYFKQELYDAVEQMPEAKRAAYRTKLANLEMELEEIKAPLQKAAPTFAALAEEKAARAPADQLVTYKGTSQVRLWELLEKGEPRLADYLHSELESTLAKGNVVAEKAVGRGLSQPTLLTFEDGTKAVWKPYESHLGNNPEAFRTSNGASEIAAYKVDRQLKLDEVPLTVSREHHGVSGTAQLFVETSAADIRSTELRPAHFASFDYLIDEPDRSSVNYLRTGDRWVAIDHGGAFDGGGLNDFSSKTKSLLASEDPAARDTLRQMFPPREAIDNLRATSPKEWKKILSPELNSKQIAAFLERRETVLGFVRQIDNKLGSAFLQPRASVSSATIAAAIVDGQLSSNAIIAAEGVATAGAIKMAENPAMQGFAQRGVTFFESIFKNTLMSMLKSLGVNFGEDEKDAIHRQVASPATP